MHPHREVLWAAPASWPARMRQEKKGQRIKTPDSPEAATLKKELRIVNAQPKERLYRGLGTPNQPRVFNSFQTRTKAKNQLLFW